MTGAHGRPAKPPDQNDDRMPGDATFDPRSGYREFFADIRKENAKRFGYDTSPISTRDIEDRLEQAKSLYPPLRIGREDKKENEGSAWFTVDAKTFLESDFPEPSWVVDQMIPAGGLTIICAKPKVGKTTFIRSLALSVARGERFLGHPRFFGPGGP